MWNKKDPEKEGKYLIKYKTKDGKIHEKEAYFSFVTRLCKIPEATHDMLVLWSGTWEEQPIAWKELK